MSEPLHPDLLPHVRTVEWLPGHLLHHPLLVTPMIGDVMNAPINAWYEQKRASLREAEAAGNWKRYIDLHERPYRVDALLHALDRGLDRSPMRFPIIARCWTSEEGAHVRYEEWLGIRERLGGESVGLMSQAERRALGGLPEVVSIWRGYCRPDGFHGLSWTLSEEKATWSTPGRSRVWPPAGCGGRRSPRCFSGGTSKKSWSCPVGSR